MSKGSTKTRSKPRSKPVKRRAANHTIKSTPGSKTAACIALLERSAGVTLAELQEATTWQPHSVRGFLSGTIKKLPNVSLISSKSDDGIRRYYLKSV